MDEDGEGTNIARNAPVPELSVVAEKAAKYCIAERERMKGIQVWALLGVVVSVYALHVEHEAAKPRAPGQEFRALCDIAWLGVSCSKVFMSKYGRMLSLFGIVPNGHALDVPNAVLGILFYSCTFTLPYLKALPKGLRSTLMLLASTLSCASSAYLAYCLIYILQDVCIVCISTYIINAIIFVLSLADFCASPQARQKKD